MYQNQLKFGPIDNFPFVGSSFTVNIFLATDANASLGKSVPFKLCLYVGESVERLSSPVHNGIEIDSSSPMEIPCGTGVCSTQVNVKILHPSGVSLFNARKFFLVAQPVLSKHFETVGSGYSDPLVAVNYRLVITNGHELPSIYYNATKGKGNKMELRVKLIDAQGNAVLTRPNLKLNIMLHYDDNTDVDQSKKLMLEIASDSKLFIGEKGEAVVRFRIINAVTRKHGNKKFRVSVSADSVQSAARFDDVSFDYSPCIDVRTKVDEKARARRIAKKKGLLGDNTTSDMKSEEGTEEDEEEEDAQSKKKFKAESFNIGTAIPTNAIQVDEDVPQFERAASLSLLELSSLGSFGPPSFSSYISLNGSLSSIPPQPPSIAVSAWAEEMLLKIERIRWKKVDSSTTTNPDMSNVHEGFEICNPNAIIDEIVESSKKFLYGPPSDPDFKSSCDQVASVAPTMRAHSFVGNQLR